MARSATSDILAQLVMSLEGPKDITNCVNISDVALLAMLYLTCIIFFTSVLLIELAAITLR